MAVLHVVLLLSALAFSASATQSATVTDHVFFDMSVGGKPAGRLVFGLFGEAVPQTAKNFKHLALHTEGFGYKNSIFHRIIPGFMAQGGDFENRDGTGGKSIYGAKFDDENFDLQHVGRGLLSMANAGPNTNGAQFFITFKDTPWLNGRHVVFGKLVSGDDVLSRLESLRMGAMDRPKEEVLVADCGTIDIDSPYELKL